MSGLRLERAGGVLSATLDRPAKRNALDGPLFAALRDAFAEASADDAVRVVVLTGAGGAFSSGGDLAPDEPSSDDVTTTMRRFGRCALALHECEKPVIAAVDGVAAGAGMSLVLGCDLVVASDRARFALLFVHHGLGLDLGASWLLPRRVGRLKANELALLGDWIDAAEAERVGIVNRVVGAGELASSARAWAERLAAASPLAVRTIRGAMARAEGLTLAEALEEEAVAQAACSASPELRAALEARRR
jgi:enoyl-CoA hydratase/carnithine racemase